jgi:hypothetical protein
MPPYNQVEHNIFWKMQMADPLLTLQANTAVQNKTPTRSQESTDPTADPLPPVEAGPEKDSDTEKTTARRLSGSVEYDKMKEAQKDS